jgi:hypothetical protein
VCRFGLQRANATADRRRRHFDLNQHQAGNEGSPRIFISFNSRSTYCSCNVRGFNLLSESFPRAVSHPQVASIRSCALSRITGEHALLPWPTRLKCALHRQVSDRKCIFARLDYIARQLPSIGWGARIVRHPKDHTIAVCLMFFCFLGNRALTYAAPPAYPGRHPSTFSRSEPIVGRVAWTS